VKARFRISRVSSSHEGDFMSLQIEDDASRVLVARLKIPLIEFTNAITQRESHCEWEVLPTARTAAVIGMECEVKNVFCEKAKSYDKKDQKRAVLAHFAENWHHSGWELWQDGTSSQQPLDQHRYIIHRWVHPETREPVILTQKGEA
jgi:hypothetical protein